MPEGGASVQEQMRYADRMASACSGARLLGVLPALDIPCNLLPGGGPLSWQHPVVPVQLPTLCKAGALAAEIKRCFVPLSQMPGLTDGFEPLGPDDYATHGLTHASLEHPVSPGTTPPVGTSGHPHAGMEIG